MTAPTDANDVLFGSNAPSAKFEQPGTTYIGIIANPPRTKQEQEWNQATQRADGAPKFFPSGDPIMTVLIDIQTQLRDPSIQNDDGIRTVYIQGKRIKDALRDAVRSAGAQKLEVGAELSVTLTGFGEPASVGARPPKEWAIRYTPAAQTAVGLGQQPQAQQAPMHPAQMTPQQGYQQPPQQIAQPQTQQAPVQQAGPTQAQIEGLINAGQDPRQFYIGVQLTPDQLNRLPA